MDQSLNRHLLSTNCVPSHSHLHRLVWEAKVINLSVRLTEDRVREGLSEPGNFWLGKVSGRGHSTCKGPEARLGLVCYKNSKAEVQQAGQEEGRL